MWPHSGYGAGVRFCAGSRESIACLLKRVGDADRGADRPGRAYVTEMTYARLVVPPLVASLVASLVLSLVLSLVASQVRKPSGPGRLPAMSTTRRTLGTGPMSTTTTAAEERTPRLLPVERIADHDQDQDQVPAKPGPGRRKLGGLGRIEEVPASLPST